MSRHLVCSALGVATLTLAVCSSACVQTQNAHRPAAQALADLRASAEAGAPEAQYNLGGMYAEGRGVPPDAVEAHMWLTIAASRSTGAEREQIVTARAAGAVRMTPTDVREAERRAQAWHAAHQGMRNRAVPPSDTGRKGLIIALELLFAL